MKLTPWRSRTSTATLRSDVSDWMKDLFEDNTLVNRLPTVFRQDSLPAVNLADLEEEFVATVELPGLNPDDIDVQLMGDHLVISGERKWEEEEKAKEFYRVESQFGSFRRAIELPNGLRLNPESIEASYDNGMLQIRIPKVEPKPTAHIKVKKK